MSKFVDVDKLLKKKRIIGTSNYCEYNVVFVKDIEEATTDEVIPKDQINKAIEKIEQYICDVETDTVKAQGMAQALDMFEQALGEVEDGNEYI